MTTHPPRKEGKFIRRATRRLNERLAPFEAKSRAGDQLRQALAAGAVRKPGSMKGHA